MAYALDHPQTTAGERYRTGGVTTTRWPRGLPLIGLLSLLLSAWGGIVPYLGPSFGYSSNGAPAWHWSLQHTLLYLVPGAVGVVISLAVLAQSRAGRAAVRASLGLSGLILIACGAWFVIGPVTWPVLHSGQVFGTATSASARFVNQVGYNLGVGVLLAALGGMVMKASTGEREIATRTAAAPAPAAGPAAPAAGHGTGAPAGGYGTGGSSAGYDTGPAGTNPPVGNRPFSDHRPGANRPRAGAGGSGTVVDAPGGEPTTEIPRGQGRTGY